MKFPTATRTSKTIPRLRMPSHPLLFFGPFPLAGDKKRERMDPILLSPSPLWFSDFTPPPLSEGRIGPPLPGLIEMVIRPKKGSVCFRLFLLSLSPQDLDHNWPLLRAPMERGPRKRAPYLSRHHGAAHSALLTRRERKNLNKTTRGRKELERNEHPSSLLLSFHFLD